jgi:hypothetical protein
MVRYVSRRILLPSACARSYTSTTVLLSVDQNIEETAVAAYWVTDGIDRCRVGFLPRHCVRQATTFDGHLVQVVALLANSDSPSQRRFSRHNRGACYATIIDTKVTQLVTSWNERTQTSSMYALASSILAGDEGDDEVAEYVGDDDEHKE